MKNRMATLTAMALSFDDASSAGGGGSAVATPPAAVVAAPTTVAAPVTTAAAPTTAEPAKSGFFKGLATSTVQAKKPEEKKADVATTKTDVKTETTAEVKTGEASTKTEAKTDTTSADTLPRPLMGRYTTLTQAEEAMRRSQDEGLRLHTENKTQRETYQKEIANRDTELAALRAELEIARTTPAFKELTKEEFAALAKENPAEAIEYAAQKRERDQNAKSAKERAAREVTERRESMLKTNDEIMRHDEEMRADPNTFPKFTEVNPIMAKIHEVTGGDKSPLRGQVWANELYYHAALGMVYKQILTKGTEVKADAASEAKLKAEAAATTTTGGKGDGGGSGAAEVDPQKKADEDWRKAVLGSAPKKFFANRTNS